MATIRERKKADGTVSYICQVTAGRDPVTGRRKFKTGVAPSKRDAHEVIHVHVAGVEGQAGNGRVGHR